MNLEGYFCGRYLEQIEKLFNHVKSEHVFALLQYTAERRKKQNLG